MFHIFRIGEVNKIQLIVVAFFIFYLIFYTFTSKLLTKLFILKNSLIKLCIEGFSMSLSFILEKIRIFRAKIKKDYNKNNISDKIIYLATGRTIKKTKLPFAILIFNFFGYIVITELLKSYFKIKLSLNGIALIYLILFARFKFKNLNKHKFLSSILIILIWVITDIIIFINSQNILLFSDNKNENNKFDIFFLFFLRYFFIFLN